MTHLLKIALETLENPATAPGLRYVACATLLSALDQAVDVPTGTHMACWRYLLSTDAGASRMHRHELAHPDVARDAVRVLMDPDAGESAQDLAMATLRGANASVVTDGDITALTARVVAEGSVRRLVCTIEQIHEIRGLAPKLLEEIRDRLAASEDPHVRAAALDVAALLPGVDVAFTHRMFSDASPLVRAGVADALAKVEGDDRTTALILVEDHVNQEDHRNVLSSCHYCLAALAGARGRRQRPVDATDEDEG